MFSEMLAMGATGGGSTLTVDTITLTGSVSSSNAYSFNKDFKYVIILDVTNSNNPTWYQNNIKINDVVITDIDGGAINGAMGGAASYTVWAAMSNIKSGDILKVVAGSYNFLMIGMN